MKKQFTAIITLLLTLLLIGCSVGSTNYSLYAIQADGITTAADESESSIKLSGKGTGVWSFGGLNAEITDWTLDGDAFSFTMQEQTINGTLSDGILSIDIDGQRMIYVSSDADISQIDLKSTDDWIADMK